MIRAGFILLSVALTAQGADASGLSLKVEPGVAGSLTQQQSQRFDLGGGVPLKLLYGLTPALDVAASASFLVLPSSRGSPSSGTGEAWAWGAGARLKRPHAEETLYGMSPWVDADLLYVRTGDLNRFGFAAGAGVAFPFGAARSLWIGPFVRYQQILGLGGTGPVDSRDAKILFAGMSFEFGPCHTKNGSAQ